MLSYLRRHDKLRSEDAVSVKISKRKNRGKESRNMYREWGIENLEY
jgi:hypothetical protein